MAIKWNGNEIRHFFEIYEPYVALWSLKHKDYVNKNVRKSEFDELVKDLMAEGLISNATTEKQLKAKIKSLKDVFRQEVVKIAKSMKSCIFPDEVYKPKLMWFENARFLEEVISTRETTSTLLKRSEDYEEDLEEDTEKTTPRKVRSSPKTLRSFPVNMIAPIGPPPLYKRLKRSSLPEEDNTVRCLDKVVNTAVEMDSFEHFGRYVAAQIRSLPRREGILLQQEIQNSITEAMLNSIPQEGTTNNVTLGVKVISASTSS